MNRRNVLGSAAITAAGLALSPTRALAQESGAKAAGISPEMAALSAYMSAAAMHALPSEAAQHAKYHLLDTLALMVSGSQLPPPRCTSTRRSR